MKDIILHEYLDKMVRDSASDLYITVGRPLTYRNGDKLLNGTSENATKETVDALIASVLDSEQLATFHKALEYNIAYTAPNDTRFRFNFFHQQRLPGMVIRHIRTTIPSVESLSLPSITTDLIMRKKGLLLVSSPTGSGKSTTVAALIGHRNKNGSGHILTIEDPIEFIHEACNCIITQREVGTDTLSFHTALKNALRQRADLVFIGEIRDKETMESAFHFAETGHLCVATMHSNNTYQAIMRIMNMFPEEMHKTVLTNLSQNLEGLLSQKLVPNVSGGRSLVLEIMLNVGLIRTLINDGRVKEIKEQMEKQQDLGMQTFDMALFNMVKEGTLKEDVALSYSENHSGLKLRFAQTDKNLALNSVKPKSSF